VRENLFYGQGSLCGNSCKSEIFGDRVFEDKCDESVPFFLKTFLGKKIIDK